MDSKIPITVNGETKLVYPPMDPRSPEYAKMQKQIRQYRETTQITIQTFCPKCGKANHPLTTSLEKYESWRKGEISAHSIWGSLTAGARLIVPTCNSCIRKV